VYTSLELIAPLIGVSLGCSPFSHEYVGFYIVYCCYKLLMFYLYTSTVYGNNSKISLCW